MEYFIDRSARKAGKNIRGLIKDAPVASHQSFTRKQALRLIVLPESRQLSKLGHRGVRLSLFVSPDCLPSHSNQDLCGSELMHQENIFEEAIREERTRIAGELDTLLQTFLSASMQLGVAADSLPSDSPVKPRLDRILQVMGEGTKQGLNTIQSWLAPQTPKRKAESRLYLVEVTAQEKEIIESVLRECQRRLLGPSATRLGIARSTLESKIRSLKIGKNRFRPHRET
jgi:Histidine kinase